MKKKLISSLLTALLIIGVVPLGASAEWRQNSDNSWSWKNDNGDDFDAGWKQIDSKWYFFKNKKIQTGWIRYMYWYYLGTDGAMKTGWINDGGKSYYLKSNGQLATNTLVDGYYLDSKGVKQPKENQKVLLDNKYVKITYLGFNDTGYSKQIKVQIDNKSNQDLIIKTDKTSVNGYMVYAFFNSNIVVSGKSAISAIEFNDSNIINDFNNIEGEFTINKEDGSKIENDDFSIKL